MNSAESLIGRVQDIIKDGSYGPSFILEKLNDALFEIADLTNPPVLMQHDVEFEISAEERYVSVPSDFFGSQIFKFYNVSDDFYCRIVYRLGDFALLSRKYSNGDVRAACLKGRKIHIAGIPTRDIPFLISYLTTPTVFTSTTDAGADIDYLPPRIGENAIVAYAAKEIYALIEDGVDGKMINTQKWERNYALEIGKIQQRFGPESTEAGIDQVVDYLGITTATIERSSWVF